ncbi:DeoR/GlpR family DNA-binding transcription regulator [Virgibacillus oceani]|uniref:DeoR family transcriptional regulator n=1 Tax=Virgibacillus oceani TaxID=1479511 RepID=A0A917HIT9_9BACI|nr:DeoR/GlpR family DNA-binding transcription regulator [Virgibacillus oceani]GGG80013.1 DeoR family transcriptional regulator [Virgibacillus oceani]
MSLSFEERKKIIIDSLENEEKVQVRALAGALEVSDETIRRDLDRLEKDGLLRKVYGGAVKSRFNAWELPFDQKTAINEKEKKDICKAAASFVKDDDIIIIGNGTTPLEIVRYIKDKNNITIITPSLPVMLLAMEIFNGRLIFIGGELEKNQKYTSGPLSEGMLQYLKANKAFIAAGGISISNGITDYDLNGSSISRKMMERSEDVFILADHTKFGRTTFAYMCSISEASMVISDKNCSIEWKNTLAKNNVELFIADDNK